jgi:hypothetical protein
MDYVEGYLWDLSTDIKVPCWYPYYRATGVILDGVMYYNYVINVPEIALRA